MSNILQEKLESSLLTSEDAEKLKINWANSEELENLGLRAALAIKIPYFTIKGEVKDFCRYRYMVDTRDNIAKLSSKKPLRYVQPKGSLPEIYLPPLIDWEEIANTAKHQIVITEGEFKAACVTKHISPCIGLGGVNSFKCNKLGTPLLPGFYEFKWTNRKVTIIFDSDVETNINVHKALISLANTLTGIGAEVNIAKIPSDSGTKIGIDDYTCNMGIEAATQLIEMAEPFAANLALHNLNTELVFIEEGPFVAEVKEDKNFLMSIHNFINANYADRKFSKATVNSNGDLRYTEVSAAREWLQWPGRRKVNKLVFQPGADRFIDGNLNTWIAWACELIEGDITPWNKLLDHLFEGHSEERLWFERWVALPMQRPGSKMHTAIVLWGNSHGTGKTLIGETIMKIYGEKSARKIENEDLDNPRHEWAENTMFVLGDEIASHEKRKSSAKLKSMITQRTIRIDKKFQPSYEIMDYINYYFTSNDPAAFYIEDSDRRYSIYEILNGPLPKEFYRDYVKWLDNGGANHLFHYFRNLDLGNMEADSRPLETQGKHNMRNVSKTDLESFVSLLNIDPDTFLLIGDEKLKSDLWTAEDLVKIYEAGDYGRNSPKIGPTFMVRNLVKGGIKPVCGGKLIKTCIGLKQLFILRNKDKWTNNSNIEEIIEHYNSHKNISCR